MISVILANGDGSRFKKAGIDTPKHLLPLEDGRPVIAHIADTLPDPLLIIDRQGRWQDNKWASRPVSVSLLPEANGVLGDLLIGIGMEVYTEILVNLCDCWMFNPMIMVEACRKEKVKTGLVTFASDDARHDYLAGGMACGGIYYFAPGVVYGCQGETLLDAVLSVENRYIHNAYRYFDVGTPEAYNAYLAHHTTNI